MTAKVLGGVAAVILLAAPLPVAAQDSDAPVDVTAAPPASSETIGPAQLQNFNLQGTVTRPAERPAGTGARQATPVPAQPVSGQTQPSESAVGTVSGAEVSAQRASTAASSGADSRASAQPTTTASPAEVTPSVPLEVTTNPAPQPGFSTLAPATEAPLTPTDASASWPWLAALLALIGGGAFIAWSRRGRRNRYADPGRLAFAGLAPDVVPEAKPFPPVRPQPRPDPVPPQARPQPAPPTAASAPKPVDDGLIVSKILKPQLAVQFVPDRLIVTGSDVALQFDVIIANSGSAPARDVLVEAQLFTAHAAQDRDIGTFFKNPIGKGDRIPAIVPLGKLSLKSAVRMPIEQLRSFELQGRKLFVPLVGFNILFRSNGDDDQVSASFLVGRGGEEDEKLAPFRLDLGPRVFRGLAARSHSMGLQQIA